MSYKRDWLNQAAQRFQNVLYIVLNAVLLEMFCTSAAAMAPKAYGCALYTTVEKREH